MKTYAVRFAAIGHRMSGGFPLDMLRYDHCYPADQESVEAIADSLDPAVRHEERKQQADKSKPLFRVRLSAVVTRKTWGPTEARWQSFGWQIEPGSLRVDVLP